MKTCLTWLALLLTTALAYHSQSRNDLFPIVDYELRRPLQYYFHLMELKAQFNPMLGSLTSDSPVCSSKSGPFCRIAGH